MRPPIFVVSLSHSAERRAAVAANLDALGLSYTFLDAVAGEALSDAEVAQAYDRGSALTRFKRELARQEIGCYLSHIAVWRRIAREAVPVAVVLEDDAVCAPSLVDLLAALGDGPHGAVMLKLCDPRRRGRRRTVATLAGGFRLTRPAILPPLTVGYVLTRDAARRLTSGSRRFARPVDIDLKHWWEHGVDILVVEPSVVATPNRFLSTIEAGRKAAGRGGPLRRLLRNLRYQTRFHAGLALGQLKAIFDRSRISGRP